MSECILCSGKINNYVEGLHVYKADPFLKQGEKLLCEKSTWTIQYEGKEIDTIITEAQNDLNRGVIYEKTGIYKLLNILVEQGVSFVMWYDTFLDSVVECSGKDELLDLCFRQIIDPSGQCEVSVMYKASRNK